MITPSSIALTTGTLYKNWYKGPLSHQYIVDKVRGDLALQTLATGVEKGFQVVLVDDGSSQDFLSEVKKIGVTPLPYVPTTMSGARRRAIIHASQLPGVSAIAWTEPEKISFVKDNLPEAALPILEGVADLVLVERDEYAFSTYPSYQVTIEKPANKRWNEMMREHKLLPANGIDMDVWFGPRIFKNTPEVVSLFLDTYHFKKEGDYLDTLIDPELWPNVIFLPIVAALYKKLKLKSFQAKYTHPPLQTKIEEGSKEFNKKRDTQYQNVIITTQELLHLLEGKPSRLFKVSR